MGGWAARVGVVISNNADSGALRRARAAGGADRHLSAASAGGPRMLDQALSEVLGEYASDWVLLAGYMKHLGPATLARFAAVSSIPTRRCFRSSAARECSALTCTGRCSQRDAGPQGPACIGSMRTTIRAR